MICLVRSLYWTDASNTHYLLSYLEVVTKPVIGSKRSHFTREYAKENIHGEEHVNKVEKKMLFRNSHDHTTSILPFCVYSLCSNDND